MDSGADGSNGPDGGKEATTADDSAASDAQAENAPDSGDADSPPVIKPTVPWSMLFGDDEDVQEGSALAVDAEGNIVVTGAFRGTIDLGAGPLTFDGSSTPFVAKLDPAGNALWSHSWGETPQSEGALRPVIDPFGNVYLGGSTVGPMNLGGGDLPATSGRDALLAKLSPGGEHVWSKRFGGDHSQAINGLALDPQGNLVIMVYNIGTMIDLGGGPEGSPYETTVHLARMSSSGAYLSSQLFTYPDLAANPSLNILPLAVDAEGSIVFCGYHGASFDPGCGSLDPAPGIFVVKLGPDGACRWKKTITATGNVLMNAMTVSPSGESVYAGRFTGDVDFGGGTRSGNGTAFVFELDRNGGYLFDTEFQLQETDSNCFPEAVALDAQGAIYATGSFRGTVDFGGGPVGPTEEGHVFVAKLSSGTLESVRTFTGRGHHHSHAIAVDQARQPIITGYISDYVPPWAMIDFGQGPLTAKGRSDGFIAKLAP